VLTSFILYKSCSCREGRDRLGQRQRAKCVTPGVVVRQTKPFAVPVAWEVMPVLHSQILPGSRAAESRCHSASDPASCQMRSGAGGGQDRPSCQGVARPALPVCQCPGTVPPVAPFPSAERPAPKQTLGLDCFYQSVPHSLNRWSVKCRGFYIHSYCLDFWFSFKSTWVISASSVT